MWSERTRLAGVALLFALSACTQNAEKPGDPRSQIRAYIAKTFNITSPSDRAQLLGFLTGDAKQRLEAWSDDQFHDAFMSSNRRFLNLNFTEVKPVSSSEVDVTYEVSYLSDIKPTDGSLAAKGHDAKITDKRICHLVNRDGKWLIADVHNVKELVDYQEEMGITAK